MATYAAIAATCEAIARLLRSSFNSADFGGANLDFEVYVEDDFNKHMDEGVSVFLYRIYHNGNNRTPPGRVLPDGSRQPTKLPVDLHFMLTAWAKTASLQHEIAGWMMRVMEDNAIIPASVLNTYKPDVFHSDEAVEIALTELSVYDMFHIWQVVINQDYQLSVPYQARMVEIEAAFAKPPLGLPVQQRVTDLREIVS